MFIFIQPIKVLKKNVIRICFQNQNTITIFRITPLIYRFIIKNIYFTIIFYYFLCIIFLFNSTDDFIFYLLCTDYMEKNKQYYYYGE